MATKIDDLSIVLSASSSQLAGDLRAAAKLLDHFKRDADRITGAGSEAAAARTAAKEASIRRRAQQQAITEQKRHVRQMREVHEHGLAVRSAKIAASSVAGAAAAFPVIGVPFALAAGGALLGIEGLASGFAELKDSVNLAAELEMTTLAFEVMLKSGERAKTMLTEIRQFAAQTPFNNAELTDSARKLIAYGIAADQVIPTLRMLGDVASATQTPIGDLSYLYGTLAAQQRAYSRDIYQFANRGIPIYEELAKVLGKSVAETKDLIEEGRVGFPEVVRAFKNMTEGKGIYAGLTARQADTFAGVREQLSDAFQMGKIKLGGILIDELGLKDAAKDLQKWVENIDHHLDRIRPAVRFFGDLGRSVAQVSGEYGKAAVNAGIFVDRISAAAMPETRRFLKEVQEFLKSGADFKISPLVVNELMFKAGDELSTVMIKTLKGIKDIGESIRNDIVKPIGQGFQLIIGNYVEAKHLFGNAKVSELYRPPAPFETDESIVARFRAMENEIGGIGERRKVLAPLVPFDTGDFATPPGMRGMRAEDERLKARQEELQAARKAFLEQFQMGDKAAPHLFHERIVPDLKGRQPVALGEKGQLQEWIEEITKFQKEMQRETADMQRVLRDQQDREQAQKEAAKSAEEARRALDAVSSGAMVAARQLMSVKAPERPQIPWSIRPDVLDAAKRAKEQHVDPVQKFVREWNDLGEALLQGVLGPMEYDRAAADLLRQAGQQMTGPTQLPDAAFAGTAEGTRAINRAMASNQGQQTTNDFLAKLVRFAERKEEIDRELLRKIAPPVMVNPPK